MKKLILLITLLITTLGISQTVTTDKLVIKSVKQNTTSNQVLVRNVSTGVTEYVDKNTLVGGGGSTQVNSDWNSFSGFSQILNKPTFKTINNESIFGSGNITISGGGSSITGDPGYLTKYNSSGNGLDKSNAKVIDGELVIEGLTNRSGLKMPNISNGIDTYVKSSININKYTTGSSKIFTDKLDNIWVVGNAMNLIKISPNKSVKVIPLPQPTSSVRFIISDNLGNIYLSTTTSVYRVVNDVVTEVPYDKTNLTSPNRLGIDSNNNLYVNQYNTGSIYKILPDNSISLLITLPQVVNIQSTIPFKLDSSNNLYTDGKYDDGCEIYKISPDGTLLRTTTLLGGTYGIRWDLDGDEIYLKEVSWSNQQAYISKIDTNGNYTRVNTEWSIFYYTSFNKIGNYIYITDYQNPNTLVRKYDLINNTYTTVTSFPVYTLTSRNSSGDINVVTTENNSLVVNTLNKINKGLSTDDKGEVIQDKFIRSDKLIMDKPLTLTSKLNLGEFSGKSDSQYSLNSSVVIPASVIVLREDSKGNNYALTTNGVYKINSVNQVSLLSTVGTSPVDLLIIDDVLYVSNSGSNNITKILLDGTSSVFNATIAGPGFIKKDSNGDIIVQSRTDKIFYRITTSTGAVTQVTDFVEHATNLPIAIDNYDNIYTTKGSSYGNINLQVTPMGLGNATVIYYGTSNQGFMFSGDNSDPNMYFSNWDDGRIFKFDKLTKVSTLQNYGFAYNTATNIAVIGTNIYGMSGINLLGVNNTTGEISTLITEATSLSKFYVNSDKSIFIMKSGNTTTLYKYLMPYPKLLTTNNEGTVSQLTEEISQRWIQNNKIIKGIPVFENNTEARAVLPVDHQYRTSTGVLMITF